MTLRVFWTKAGLDFAERRPKRSRRIAWVDFLRPAHGNVFLNVSIQEAFGVFQWMVRTGGKHRGVLECLSAKSTCVGFREVDGFTASWRAQLRERFTAAILEPFVRHGVWAWREENRIDVSESRMVVFPHYVGGGPDHCDDRMRERVDALFAIAGRTLAKSHNEYHPNARTVFQVSRPARRVCGHVHRRRARASRARADPRARHIPPRVRAHRNPPWASRRTRRSNRLMTARVNTCASCRHSARGHAIDLRPIRARGNPIRPSLQGGDYICARTGLTPAKVDPVSGFQALPSGPDCRDLNPDGACEHYRRGLGLSLTMVVIAALVAFQGL